MIRSEGGAIWSNLADRQFASVDCRPALLIGRFKIGMKWKERHWTVGSGHQSPYRMADATGSNSYLKEDTAATNHVNGNYRNSLGEVKNGAEKFISRGIFGRALAKRIRRNICSLNKRGGQS